VLLDYHHSFAVGEYDSGRSSKLCTGRGTEPTPQTKKSESSPQLTEDVRLVPLKKREKLLRGKEPGETRHRSPNFHLALQSNFDGMPSTWRWSWWSAENNSVCETGCHQRPPSSSRRSSSDTSWPKATHCYHRCGSPPQRSQRYFPFPQSILSVPKTPSKIFAIDVDGCIPTSALLT